MHSYGQTALPGGVFSSPVSTFRMRVVGPGCSLGTSMFCEGCYQVIERVEVISGFTAIAT